MLKVNPTTKRLNIFQKMAVSRKAERSIIPYVQKNITKVENPIIQDGLQAAFDFFKSKSCKNGKFRILQIDNIIQKYNQCKNPIALGEIEECGEWLLDVSNEDKPRVLGFMEDILDAINCSNEQYCNLYKHSSNYGPLSLIEKLKSKQILRKARKVNPSLNCDSYKELFYSEPRKLYADIKKLGKEINTEAPEYKNFAKYSALKNLIFKYNLNQAEVVNALYKEAYLAKQDKSVRKYTQRVQDKTGIKILDYTTDTIPEKELYKVEKELETFNNMASYGSPLIDYLEINPVDYGFITGAEGSYYKRGNKNSHITIPNWSEHFLRHELTHATDLNMRFVPTEPEVIENIKKDLTKVGAPKFIVKYAEINEAEAKAVLGEYYNKDFSPETKNFMIKSGLPKKILELKNVDFYDLLIKHRSFNDKELETIEEIRTRFDGIIPEKIYDCIVKEPVFEIKKVVELTKGKDNIKPEDFVEIFEALTKLERLKSDKNYLENGIRFKREIPRGITCLDNIIDSPRQMRTLIHKYEIEIELAEIELGKLLNK